MFGLGDDFDIDDDFLDEVFQVEKASQSRPQQETHHDVSRNLEQTRLNILTESNASCDYETDDNASSFNLSRNRTENGLRVKQLNRTTVRKNESSGRDVDPRKVRVRKFPGPAGLLPQRQSNTSLIATEDFLNELEEELRQDALYKEEEVLSQDSARRLESPVWAELSKDLGDDGQTLLSRLNVASVCSRAKETRALKVPFLALLVQNVDASTSDPCLYLSDPTGEMVGAVHREVWEQLGEDLVAGAVIVLINVGVLCAGVSSSRHYLNITSNNIAAVYSPTDGSDIRVTNIKPLSQPECSKFLLAWQELLSSQIQPPLQSSPETSQALFSTASFNPISYSTQKHSFPQRNRLANQCRDSSFEISLNSPIASGSPFRSNMNHTPNISMNNFSPINRSSNRPCLSNLPQKSNQPKVKPKFNPRLPSDPSHRSKNTTGFHNQSTPKSFKATCNTNFKSKRPRIDSSSQFASPVASSQNQSVVESLLDGIDTDSLFGDF